MRIGRTAARTTLITTAALATFALAACAGGQQAASGGATTSAPAAGGSTFIPVTTVPTGAPAPTTTTAVAPAAGGGGGETGGGTTECKPANLTLSLSGSDAAAGHVYQALRFTNTSKVPCVIVGYPGVSYVTGDNGTQVGAAAARDGAIGPQITLQPGQVASAVITLTDVGNFDPSACKPTSTRGLRVYPPDSTASMFVAQNGTGCAGTPPSPQLRVQTIKAGPGNP